MASLAVWWTEFPPVILSVAIHVRRQTYDGPQREHPFFHGVLCSLDDAWRDRHSDT